MRERLEGLKLVELGRKPEEVLVLARRMIEMGRAVADRFASAEADEIRESILFAGGPKIREMLLVLPKDKLMTLRMTQIDERPTTLAVTYHLPDEMFYEDIDFGTIKIEHLEMEPADAARELTYTSKRVEEGNVWAVHLNQIKSAPAVSPRNANAPWGMVH